MIPSVIIPAYNCEETLAKALHSIQSQTYEDFECIIVNDGSTDNTGEIAREYALMYDRFSVIEFPTNRGVSAARNAGMAASEGDAYLFVDADDYAHEELLEYLMKRAEQYPDCGRIFSPPTTHPIGKTPKVWYIFPFGIHSGWGKIFFLDSAHDPGHVTGNLYIADKIGNLRFAEDISFCEDTLFNMQLMYAKVKTYVCGWSGYHYVRREDSLTQRIPADGYIEKMFAILDAKAKQYDVPREVQDRCQKFLENAVINQNNRYNLWKSKEK